MTDYLSRIPRDEIEAKNKFLELVKSINKAFVNGRESTAEYLGHGSFGHLIKVFINGRPKVIKIFSSAETKMGMLLTREAHIHNEANIRIPSRYLATANDSLMVKIRGIANSTIDLVTVPYTAEYIEPDMIGTVQDYVEGQTLADWRPTDPVELADVFSDLAESQGVFRDNGLADTDRGANNIIVVPRGTRDSRIVHIDLGAATLLNFNVTIAFRLLRFDRYFSSYKDYAIYVLKLLHSLATLSGEEQPQDLGLLNFSELNQAAESIFLQLAKMDKMSLKSIDVVAIVNSLAKDEITDLIKLFRKLIDRNPVLEMENQERLNMLLRDTSFSFEISEFFAKRNPGINWLNVLQDENEINSLVDGYPAQFFGNPSSPCPATYLGMVHTRDIEKMAVCANYQMMWSLFTKLGTGLSPMNLNDLQRSHNGDLFKAFNLYMQRGLFPMTLLEDFLDPSDLSTSMLAGYSREIKVEVFNFFMDFFEKFHYTEVFDKGSYRGDYRDATKLIDQFREILQLPPRANLAVEG